MAGLALFQSCSGPERGQKEAPTSSTSLSRLSAKGSKVVNENGEEVILRTIGLGGWLLQEGYMLNPQGSTIGTQWQMKKLYYEEGLSEEEVEDFYQQWRDNFITEKDIHYLASLGFNAVRIPMHYELFLSSEQRSARNQVIKDSTQLSSYIDSLSRWLDDESLFAQAETLEGIKVLDRLLDWCEQEQMYVILDLHAAPGGQGTDVNIADILVKNDLWYRKDAQGRLIYQDITVSLWEMLSQRYINDDRIAWYDLINEPNNIPSNQPIHDLYERLINSIRASGDQHMIMIEGNGWGNNYDLLLPKDFSTSENLIYSAHRYWIPPQEDSLPDPNPNQINRMVNLLAFRDREQVPVWIGETGENTNEWLAQNIAKLDAANIGWCHWTYKRFDLKENAALTRINGPFPTDGKKVMAQVIENIKFENNPPNENTIRAVAPEH